MQFLNASYVIVPKQALPQTLLIAKKLAKALQDKGVPATVSLSDKATSAHKIIIDDIHQADDKTLHLNHQTLDVTKFDDDAYLNALLGQIAAMGSTNAAVGGLTTVDKPLNIVAVTACPTGVAHTFMSAEAIENYAKAQGWNIKVETRGQVGAGNAITPEEVAAADLVFVAADIDVDLSKFAGKKMYRTSTGLALKKTAQEFEKALSGASTYQSNAAATDVQVADEKKVFIST